MINLRHFTVYTPEKEQSEIIKAIMEFGGALPLFLRAETGEDWYDSQGLFSADTIKVAYNETGVVEDFSSDVSKIVPVNLSVVELPSIPEGIDTSGAWVFNGNDIIPRVYTIPELTDIVERERTRKVSASTIIIDPLKDAVELNRATEEDKIRLDAWKNYRVDLIQLDVSEPGAIDWPVEPQ